MPLNATSLSSCEKLDIQLQVKGNLAENPYKRVGPGMPKTGIKE
jgi:hypothetical protein